MSTEREVNKQRAIRFREMHFETYNFPWYDSYWLHSFHLSKAYLAAYYPGQLEAFVAAFEVLKTDPNFKTYHLPDFISHEIQVEIQEEIEVIKQNKLEAYELFQFGRLIQHDVPLFNRIQAELLPKIEAYTGESLEVSYNFLSLYTNLGVLPPHMDAPLAKWTLDVCIEQSTVWPIQLSQVLPWCDSIENFVAGWEDRLKQDPKLGFETFELAERSAVLFSGSSQWHYRERISSTVQQQFCHLLFFHFRPKGTQVLTEPSRWSAHFGIPELAELVVDFGK